MKKSRAGMSQLRKIERQHQAEVKRLEKAQRRRSTGAPGDDRPPAVPIPRREPDALLGHHVSDSGGYDHAEDERPAFEAAAGGARSQAIRLSEQ
jgi:hypothetical protein